MYVTEADFVEDFFILKEFQNIDTANAGKITICYNSRFHAKFRSVCGKHRKFPSDFNDVFIETVLIKSINCEGDISNAKTVAITDIDSDSKFKIYKVKKFWSTDLRRNDGIRIDYIFSKETGRIFLLDLRLKNIRTEENHDVIYLRSLMAKIKAGEYRLLSENSSAE